MVVATVSQAQSVIISGVVSDENNLPLPAATVIVKGTTNGTSTDFDGNYKIKANTGDILVFSYVGYATKEITIGTELTISLSLIPDNSLDEVAVTALGIERKPSEVSSLSSKVSGVAITYDKDIEHKSLSKSEYKSDYQHQTNHSQLTAGEINDLKKWNEWLDILKQEQFNNLKTKWGFGLTQKLEVFVTDDNQNPVTNILLKLYNQDLKIVMSAKTDINGKAVLFKDLYETIENECYTIQLIHNGNVVGKRLNNDESKVYFKTKQNAISNAVDVMFTIDATGSMADEINYLKAELSDIINRVDESVEEKRLALNFYRDFGDAYVTKPFNFSANISEMQKHLKKQNASGGGDYEEAVEEALKVSMQQDWNENAKAKLLFLLLDAPPHFNQKNVALIKKQINLAQQKGIKIIPIVASDANKDVEFLMRFFSVSTNGTYVFLTDDSGIGNKHMKATTKDFKVEKLNDLIVRLIKEYTIS